MTMRAATYDRFGGPDVVELRQVPVPGPARGEVRIEIVAASINPLDWKLLRGDFRWLRPRVPIRRIGCDFAGRVQAVGTGVTGWRAGDEVFGSLKPLPGKQGSLAELAVAPAADLARKPAGLPFAEAAALPIAGGSALRCLELSGARPSAETLVIGASGGVGSFCVQLATLRGARVTAVCHSRNGERVRSLGAAEVVAYDRENVLSRPPTFDAIIDAAGVHSFRRCAPLLRPSGCYVTTVGRPADYLAVWRSRLLGGRQARALLVRVTPGLLAELARLTETAGLRPVIGARFPLAEARQALALSASGHAVGKIVVEVEAR
jgi:NADPH:quinone reductase-like Zn-dependent oxidoreductase